MKLSKRLQVIADLIPPNKKVFDIGCNHAYLDIYLTTNRSNSCTAADLDIRMAEINIAKTNLNNKIKTVQTDGLNELDINENDIVVLAGLGGKTIIQILKENKSLLPNTLIIQSNNNLKSLRQKVVLLGYYIKNEKYVLENKKHYVIIEFSKGHKKYNNNDFVYGPILSKDRIYLDNLYNYYCNLYNKVPFKRKLTLLSTIIFLKIKKKLY